MSIQFLHVAGDAPLVETEYGVLFPNGEIQWGGRNFGYDYTTKEGRAAYIKDYQERLRNMSLADIPKPVFIERQVTTTFIVPTISRLK